MPQTNLGRVAFRFKGLYNSDSIYKKNDVVFDGESSFVSQVDNNIGNSLSDEINWALMAGGHNNDYRIIKAGSDSMTPSVPFAQKVLSNSGSIHSRSVANSMGYQYLDSIGNIKLLFCPQIGVKLRESGIYKYTEKLYGFGNINIDAAQTTALNQPYLSGNIAPNEKYALKSNNGTDLYMTHTPISFSTTDKWSISTVICMNRDRNISWCIGGNRGSANFLFGFTYGYRFSLYINGVLYMGANNISRFFGKNIIITLSAFGNNILNIYVNGALFDAITAPTNAIIGIFGSVFEATTPINGTISYHCVRDIALTPTQVADEYNYLRTLFPEIESVQIGTQTWATSNCEMTCTPQGNVIQEVKASSNTEKITNYNDREFNVDSGFWVKGGQTPPSIVGGICNISCPVVGDSYIAANIPLIIGRFYKVIYSIKRNSVGSLNAFSGGGTPIDSSVGNNKVAYFIANNHSSFALGRRVSPTDIDIDNVYVQEVGWADSTNLYNYVYANTTGTAEQKEYAAVKAAAMWSYYNNDSALGAVYGKLYNWYAVRLLQMDIDYYNAANPMTPWGWRVPTSADFTALSTYLGGNEVSGGKMKKEGTLYWGAPNTGATNESGFSSIGGGYRDQAGPSYSLNALTCYRSQSYEIMINKASDTTNRQLNDAAMAGFSLRLIKS